MWLAIFVVLVLGVGSPAFAAGICGEPPPTSNEVVKGEIQGQAQVLSRFLGNTSLAGRIETSRSEIFSHYKNANQFDNAYYEYMVCSMLMSDTKMSTDQKLDKLVTIRRAFAEPVKKNSG